MPIDIILGLQWGDEGKGKIVDMMVPSYQIVARYEKSYGYKQHDHLICTNCKRIVEFCDPRLHRIEQNVGDFLNFDIIHHSLLLYGKCRDEHCTHKPTP